jgi:hypothetical protein
VYPALATDHVIEGPRGRYRILAEHGRGGFGITYRGEREGDGRPVIVKTLRLAGLPGWKAFELFEREAAVLRALQHPNVPAWIDDVAFGQDGSADSASAFALVMELIPGRNLREVTRAGGLSPAEMFRWLRDVLEVLAFIHGRSPPLIHRDVNPKNIILRPDGSAALVDFGCVQAALRSADTVSSTSAGTFGYAPLEQFIGQATPVSDLYSLGMTFLAAATGREPNQLPFQGLKVDVRKVLRDPPHVVSLMDAMVEPDPRFRISGAAAALEVLAGTAQLAPSPGGDRDAEGAPRTAPRISYRDDRDGRDHQRAGPDREAESAGARPAAFSGREEAVAEGDSVRERAALAPLQAEDYLGRLAGKLRELDFEVVVDAEVGRSPVELAAHRSGSGWSGIGLHLYAVRAERISGARAGKALPPVPAAVFVQAAAALHLGDEPGFWGRLLGQRQVVVPLFVCPAGVGPRTRGHVAAAVREPASLVVVPAIIDLLGEGFELITPPSLLPGDPGGVLDSIRRLLSLPGGP